MYSDVTDELLHRVVFEVTVPAVHLKGLVADLLREDGHVRHSENANRAQTPDRLGAI